MVSMTDSCRQLHQKRPLTIPGTHLLRLESYSQRACAVVQQLAMPWTSGDMDLSRGHGQIASATRAQPYLVHIQSHNTALPYNAIPVGCKGSQEWQALCHRTCSG